jgi:hypothetical protein
MIRAPPQRSASISAFRACGNGACRRGSCRLPQHRATCKWRMRAITLPPRVRVGEPGREPDFFCPRTTSRVAIDGHNPQIAITLQERTKGLGWISPNPLILLAPRAGLEPATKRLTAG